MYLIMTEFNEMYYAEHISKSDESACADGIVSIFNLEPNIPTEFDGEQWNEIPRWEHGEEL